MKNDTNRVYSYRWVVLGSFMMVNLAIQLLWISYAPVTGVAAAFYGVSDLKIGLLSMLFMIAFIPLSIPVSWAIDTLGFRKTVSAGVALMGVAAIARGLAGANYALVFATTIGLAAAQPFMLNAWTKIPALWFPPRERATAVGLITLANLVGTALGMVLTPALSAIMSIPSIQLYYGIFSAACAALFIATARERPATPPSEDAGQARSLMLDGLKHAFKIPSFRRYLFISFIGLGVFNGITTWIEAIVRPRGFSPQDAGTFGAIMRDPEQADIDVALAGLAEASAALSSGSYDLVVLDELNVAVNLGLIPQADVLALIATRPPHVELVITGRYASDAVKAAADLVTEMREIKHYYKKGIEARTGIER